jgi:hypothetical protein
MRAAAPFPRGLGAGRRHRLRAAAFPIGAAAATRFAAPPLAAAAD